MNTKYFIDTWLSVAGNNLSRPLSRFRHPHPVRVTANPQFKVPWRIVEFVGVFMMHLFSLNKRAAKFFLHYVTMFKYPSNLGTILRHNANPAVATAHVFTLEAFNPARLSGNSASGCFKRIAKPPGSGGVDVAEAFGPHRQFAA